MSQHSFFSPSSAHRWIPCPGSMAWPENQEEGGSSTFADDGTASHAWAAEILRGHLPPHGEIATINGREYVLDEERLEYIAAYVEDVQRRTQDGLLFVEYRVDLSQWLGEGQSGTADAVILRGDTLTVIDLKYGVGEKVDAKQDGGPNYQLGLYALGALSDAVLMGYEIKKIVLVVHQPRLVHIDEFECTRSILTNLALKAKNAVVEAGIAMVGAPEDGLYLNPSDAACRWCRAKSKCPALQQYVTSEVRKDFDVIAAETPTAPSDTAGLSRAMIAVPLVEQWCSAVREATHKAVEAGKEVIGSDGLPMKFVEGKMGSRAWIDKATAEAALVGQLGDKAYHPPKLITAPEAAKLLDKKKTAELWNDVFAPLITRSPGKPLLALGSDERPPYTGKATATDFNQEE